MTKGTKMLDVSMNHIYQLPPERDIEKIKWYKHLNNNSSLTTWLQVPKYIISIQYNIINGSHPADWFYKSTDNMLFIKRERETYIYNRLFEVFRNLAPPFQPIQNRPGKNFEHDIQTFDRKTFIIQVFLPVCLYKNFTKLKLFFFLNGLFMNVSFRYKWCC